MRIGTALILLSGLVALSRGGDSTNNGRRVKRCDVAVIGGGGGGANAAVFAKDKGYSVCIVEKNAQIGGHCSTVKLPASQVPASCPLITMFGNRCPDWVDLGVFVYSNSTAAQQAGFGTWTFDTVSHLKRFVGSNNVATGDFEAFGPRPLLYGDFQLGLPFQFPQPTPQQFQAFETALIKLVGIAYTYPWLDDAGNFPDPIPAELLVPFSQFVAANQLEVLYYPFLQSVIGITGLGDVNQLTTLYAMLNLRRGILSLYGVIPSTQGGVYVYGGCRTLYDGIANYIGEDNVYTGATVTAVKRNVNNGNDDDDGDEDDVPRRPIRVDFTIGNKRYRIKAKKLIMAIPPTAGNMAFLVDQTTQEASLFSKTKLRYYVPAVLSGTGPVDAQLAATQQGWYLYNLDFNQPYLIPKLPNSLAISKLLYYQFPAISYYAQQPEDLATTIANINAKLPTVPSLYLTATLNYALPHSQYNPYFSAADLAANPHPYTAFKNIQGNANTLWVGATYSFAEQSKVMEHAYRLVQAKL